MQSWDFLVVSPAFKNEFQRVYDLRQQPEKRLACALQIAKQADYSPKHGPFMVIYECKSPSEWRFEPENRDLTPIKIISLIGVRSRLILDQPSFEAFHTFGQPGQVFGRKAPA